MTNPAPGEALGVARDPGRDPLLTDLYQLNMIEGYLANNLTETAIFEFFCRTPPANRRFLVAAGGLDEWRIAALIAEGAPIDGFGVGTSLATAEDAPALDCAYTLQEYAGRPRRKKSTGKATQLGRKQIFRAFDTAGRMAGNLLGLADMPEPGAPLPQALASALDRVRLD